MDLDNPLTQTTDTYIDIDSGPVEGGDWRRVPRHVTIELVAVLVPLDGVQAVPLQVKVALELRGGRPQNVVRYSHLRQPQPRNEDQQVTCNWEWKDDCVGLVMCGSSLAMELSINRRSHSFHNLKLSFYFVTSIASRNSFLEKRIEFTTIRKANL